MTNNNNNPKYQALPEDAPPPYAGPQMPAPRAGPSNYGATTAPAGSHVNAPVYLVGTNAPVQHRYEHGMILIPVRQPVRMVCPYERKEVTTTVERHASGKAYCAAAFLAIFLPPFCFLPFCMSSCQVKVTVIGAAGGIGQPLALLLKANPLITELALYDVAPSAGVAADLSHINTPAKVTGYRGDDQLPAALSGAHLVVIPAGVPRKPGMTRDDLFNINAGIVKGIATAIAKNSPKAFVAVISNPVNSTVPIVAEVLKQHGVYDPKRVFGVTTLDIVRANTFVGELKGADSQTLSIPVIGGHSGVTIIPVLSASGHTFSDSERETLVHRIQYGGDEVVKAKDGAGSATLSMAFAGARFANSVLEASVLKKAGVKECTFVKSDVVEGLEYFSTVVELGAEGVAKIHPIPNLSEYERKLFDAAVPELKGNIQKGVDFVNKS
ncbi:malate DEHYDROGENASE, NAD-dependent [Rhizophlyctis rosea]|uniref:malate dehydrogenase n=1 Tax=Rhizophlyctis rosea TaxID=64517 RepID=A0AAD5SKS5_9FUNG|nr:malate DEHYDROGENASE, NAD-dependent [Rhizophlyctis rosea]